MFLKLVKHEFKAVNRILIPLNIILLSVSIVCRIIMIPLGNTYMAEVYNMPINNMTQHPLYIALVFSMASFYIITIFVIPVLAYIFLGIRFYKNLFTEEGYISISLPVTPLEHLFSKLIVAACWLIISIITMIISLIIFFSFPTLIREIINNKVWEVLWREFSDSLIVIFGYLFNIIIAPFSSMLIMYACICLGQLHQKARGIMSIVYFGCFYVVSSLVSISLPVTPLEHLFSKLIVAACWLIISIITMIISLIIFFSFPTLIREIINNEVWEVLWREFSDSLIVIFGYLFNIIIAPFSSMLIMYACICLGQLHQKARGIMSIVYFGCFYVVSSLISILGFSIVTSIITGSSFREVSWISEFSILYGNVVNVIFLVVSFFICKYIMTKKINLQ